MSSDRSVTAARTTTVEEALALILSSLKAMPAEDVPLAEAGGRVLAASITAVEDLWPFPRAAMDGMRAGTSFPQAKMSGRAKLYSWPGQS